MVFCCCYIDVLGGYLIIMIIMSRQLVRSITVINSIQICHYCQQERIFLILNTEESAFCHYAVCSRKSLEYIINKLGIIDENEKVSHHIRRIT